MKQPKLYCNQTQNEKNQRLLDVVYEAQMLILEKSETNLCCFVIKED